MKLPALQFYPGDWRKDNGVQALDFFARGVWFEILLLMHESERRGVLLLNGAAMPDEALSSILGLPLDLLKQNLTKVLTYGVASIEPETGALMSRRMVRDENIRKIRQEAGKLGGNPVLLNQTGNQKPTSQLKQKPTPSSSSSSSSSEEEELLLTSSSVKKAKDSTPIPFELNIPGFSEEWNEFRNNRKAKKAVMTPRAEELILRRLSERPGDAIHALQTAIVNNWTGFEWEWFDKKKGSSNGHKESRSGQWADEGDNRVHPIYD